MRYRRRRFPSARSETAVACLSRRGFTIVELLVAVAVIGLLCALILAGVQAAREAARRAQCASNLKQIGIALQAYQDMFRCFPLGNTRGFSFHTAILPQIEQSALSQMFDRSTRASRPANRAVSKYVIPAIYVCPSDGAAALERAPRGTNYGACYGSGYQFYGYNGVFRPSGHGDTRGVAAQEVLDGLSRTAAVAEILAGSHSDLEVRRMILATPTLDLPTQLDLFADTCQALTVATSIMPGNLGTRGRPWSLGDVSETGYNHVLPPNSNSCQNGTHVPPGAYSAGSMHSGGAQTLYADAHVEFTSSDIARMVWRAIGSRNGRDAE